MARKSSRRAKSKQDFKRRRHFRTERDKVLIVTEGTKTEPDYFRRLISELGLTTAKVKITGEGGSAPISVFETAEALLGRDDDFEQIYVVFDRDRHETYDDAIAKVVKLNGQAGFEKKTIVAVTSVPCFEVWYGLHLSDANKPYGTESAGASPAKALISDLKKAKLDGVCVFKHYEKSDCGAFYKLIVDQRPKAQLRAESLLDRASKQGATLHHEDPSTRVHILVEALVKLSKN